MSKLRVMAIHDIHVDTPQGRLKWAYARRSDALARYAPDDMQIDTFQYSEVPWKRAGEYDVIYQIEYASINSRALKGNPPNRNVPVCVSYNSDPRRRLEYWPRARKEADFLIVNNLEAFNHFGREKGTCCISNGICGETFRYTVPIEERPQKVFWRGSSGPRKMKGWLDVLQPAMERLRELGFDPDFKPVDNIDPTQCVTTDVLSDLYNQSSYVVCTSVSEGSPNYQLEAATVGCVPVSCNVGNILEFGRHDENCVIIERSTEALIQGLLYAQEHRERLSHAIRETMQGWTYGEPGHRAQWYYAVFRKLAAGQTIKPFSYHETHWSEI